MTRLARRDLALELVRARSLYLEDPEGSLATAVACQTAGEEVGDQALSARGLALQGQIALHRGDIGGALTLAVDAERAAALVPDDLVAGVEVAAVRATANFFTGAYTDALTTAERCIRLADSAEDLGLRIFARRTAFLVISTFAATGLEDRLQELLALTIEADDPWEQVITRNDIACSLEEVGEVAAARAEIDLAFELAGRTSPNRFAHAVLHSTRADIELRAGDGEAALWHAERSIELLAEARDPNPYVLGASVRAQVQARMELGRLEEAVRAGESALEWLGDRLPRTRSVILSAVATALREAGQLEYAFDALARSAELERQASAEISGLLVTLERAKLAASAARSESEELAEKNRQLAAAHAELETRTRQLEVLQEQLRDQAERDWLTGVHNRRYLARELARPVDEGLGTVFSVAMVDLDHFKEINDGYGHAVGDQVLIRAAGVLRKAMRTSDIVVRSGGEEFLLVMPFTDAVAAHVCCERVRVAMHAERWAGVAPGLELTASIGVATAEEPAEFETIARLADRHLYQAKQAGRNRVFAGSDRRAATEQA
jgi:diguanylate cyclase (GGDEF)-like protein